MVLGRVIIAAGGIVVGYMCAGGGMTLVEKYGAFKVAGCLVGTALAVYAVAQVPLSVTAERTYLHWIAQIWHLYMGCCQRESKTLLTT